MQCARWGFVGIIECSGWKTGVVCAHLLRTLLSVDVCGGAGAHRKYLTCVEFAAATVARANARAFMGTNKMAHVQVGEHRTVSRK